MIVFTPAFTVPQDENRILFVPRTSPVSTFEPEAEMVDDTNEMAKPETVAVVRKLEPLVAVSTADPAAVSASPTRLVACTWKFAPAVNVLVVVTTALSVFIVPTEMPTFVAPASIRDDAPEIVRPTPLMAPDAALSATFVPAVVSSAALKTEIVTWLMDALEQKKLPADAVIVTLVPASPVPAALSTSVLTDAPVALTVQPPAAVKAVEVPSALSVKVSAGPVSTIFDPAEEITEPDWKTKEVEEEPVRK